MFVDEACRDLLRYLSGREVVARVHEALSPAAIPLLPLKGVYLQAVAYDPPERRRITDVDLLVPVARYAEAVDRLTAAGFVACGRDLRQTALRHPELALPVDLHRCLFTRGAFALDERAIFERARPDAAHFGVEVWLPDPRDALSHLVGHFVKNRGTAGAPQHLSDFEALGDALQLDPVNCARHLEGAGLARAARYAFGEAAEQGGHFSREVLDALPPDPAGRVLVALLRRTSPHLGSSVLGAVPGFLLDRSVGRGALSLLWRALDKRHEARQRSTRQGSPRDPSANGAS